MKEYEADYPNQYPNPSKAVGVAEDRTSLGQELQHIHKLISQHDDMLDMLSSKLESVLSPPTPHPAPPDVAPSSPGQCSLREEMTIIQNRWSNQLSRLSEIINRIDT